MSCTGQTARKHTVTDRLIITPIKHQVLWDAYQRILATFWRPQEILLSTDVIQWKDLDKNLKLSIEKILAFFATSDTLVQINLLEFLAVNIDVMEAQYFYAYQSMNENIHSETYALLLDTLSTTPQKRAELVESIQKVKPIRKKIDWILRWLNSQNESLLLKLFVFAIVEGIFFSSSFAFIHAVKQLGVLPGLVFSNELISRDERAHYEFAHIMYNFMLDRGEKNLDASVMCKILKDAVDVEIEFAEYVMNDTTALNFSPTDMYKYVKFLANELAKDFNLTCLLYPDCNFQPLAFMVNMNLFGKTNFFEKNVSEYGKYDEPTLSLENCTF